MKKFWYSIAAAIAVTIVGCKTLPTVERMFENSRLIGMTTAMVANSIKTDDTCRNAIIEIVSKVQYCIPQTNETFETAWTPIAEQHVQKLFDDNVIDKEQGEIILCAFKTVVKGIDYVMNVRYPQARQYQELTEAAIHGFCLGFLTDYKPANMMSASTAHEYDEAAYKYLTTSKLD